jgi:hypothetical protein
MPDQPASSVELASSGTKCSVDGQPAANAGARYDKDANATDRAARTAHDGTRDLRCMTTSTVARLRLAERGACDPDRMFDVAAVDVEVGDESHRRRVHR